MGTRQDDAPKDLWSPPVVRAGWSGLDSDALSALLVKSGGVAALAALILAVMSTGFSRPEAGGPNEDPARPRVQLAALQPDRVPVRASEQAVILTAASPERPVPVASAPATKQDLRAEPSAGAPPPPGVAAPAPSALAVAAISPAAADPAAAADAGGTESEAAADLKFEARIPVARPDPPPRVKTARAGTSAKNGLGPPPDCGKKRARWRYVNKKKTWYCR